jgi:hypothetical protein
LREPDLNAARAESMLQKSLIGRVLLQVLGVCGYCAVVVVSYWRGLTDVGAVAIIVALLFLFQTLVSSGTISIAHLFPSDPETNVRSPTVELLKMISFFAVGMGAVVDLRVAVGLGVVPGTLATASIFLTLIFVCVACVGCCLARFTVAFIYGTRR